MSSTSDRAQNDASTTGKGATAVPSPPKTSAAATFSLVFGLSALFTVLLAVLAPIAIVFGLIGLILGVVGMKKTKDIDVTGKGLAIGGLVLSVLSLLLGIALLVGATIFVNSGGLDAVEQRIQDARGELPDEIDVPSP